MFDFTKVDKSKKNTMKKVLYSLLLIIPLTTVLSAQPNLKLARVVKVLEHSDFTITYMNAKQQMEAHIFSLKQQQHYFSEEDIALIKKGYDETKIKFDRILDDLKINFATRRHRRDIEKNPDAALQAMLTNDFITARNYFNDNCKQRIDALINADSGAFNPLFIITVIGITGETFNIINKIRMDKIEGFEQYFETHYAKGKKLKTWEDI